ncbi:DUF721 domain-containing protein [Flavobacterium okayamense]|uniref:DUF721 domain-containing protein n=1 Tax=Flavobacterium okayamense TaxID=2830782 RepID=A0ABM7S552_9FLAO|nr:DUF721 domain-containing protein [Flavobacterium okayamense]BCY28556.1 hypothetical protein KK2020170_14240 [Flavobacterium okayamense]
MNKRSSEENSISDVLKSFIETNKLQNGLDKINVRDAWKNVMGPGVNNYTTDVVLKNSTLYVVLTSAVLREELLYGKEKIITILNEELRRDIIKEINFK